MMTGEEAIAFLHSVPWQGTRLGLDRTKELLCKLGNPERKLRFIHIAGTNGKGSTAAMTASVLQKAGYRTGLYISPFLEVFNERMSVNGALITDEELGSITEKVRPAAESMEDMPTEFEWMTAIALLFFLRRGCDIVVLEVGMGGRLDSTNVIPAPEAAVICNIGLDHVKELGDTKEKIAFEKAGIIKRGSDVVLYQQEPSVQAVLEQACAEQGITPHTADFSKLDSLADSIEGQNFRYCGGKEYRIGLLGEHQLHNAAVVLELIGVLRQRGFEISEEALHTGLAEARWPGRFEVLHQAPCFIADGGHNDQCAAAVADALQKYFPGRKVLMIMGVLADKDHEGIIRRLSPLAERFYAVTPDSPRALSAKDLAERLALCGKPVTVCENAADAVEKVFADAAEEDIICSVGSLYMTGAIRTAVLHRNS